MLITVCIKQQVHFLYKSTKVLVTLSLPDFIRYVYVVYMYSFILLHGTMIFLSFLAHLSRRLIGELNVYPCSGVRPSVIDTFQTSSPLKPLGQPKPNFMWSPLGRGNESLFTASGSHDQGGRHTHIW